MYPTDFKAGDEPPRSAQFFRDLLAMVRDWKRGLFTDRDEDVNTKRLVGYVKNQTDSNLDMYSVVGLDAPMFARATTERTDRLRLKGVVPESPEHCGRFGVYIEPVRNQKIGRAVLSGITLAKINVTKLQHRWADVTDEDPSKLTSRDAGGAEILEVPTTTGVQLLWVRIGHSFQRTLLATLDYNLYGNSDTAATLYDDGRSIRVKCELLEDEDVGIAKGTKCYVVPQPHEDIWLAIAVGNCVKAREDLDSGDDEPEE